MKSVYTELRFTGIYSIINPERGGQENGCIFTNSSVCISPKAKITLVFLFLGPVYI